MTEGNKTEGAVEARSTVAGEPVNQASVQQIVVFRLGQEEYGLHIGQIREVVITPPITRMPQAPAYIKGVANIRGNVIAMIDLEKRFGLPVNEEAATNLFTLVIASDEYKMGILSREVPNTLTISSSSIEGSVLSGDGQGDNNYINGIVKLDKRLIIMIDILKVITSQDQLGLRTGESNIL